MVPPTQTKRLSPSLWCPPPTLGCSNPTPSRRHPRDPQTLRSPSSRPEARPPPHSPSPPPRPRRAQALQAAGGRRSALAAPGKPRPVGRAPGAAAEALRAARGRHWPGGLTYHLHRRQPGGAAPARPLAWPPACCAPIGPRRGEPRCYWEPHLSITDGKVGLRQEVPEAEGGAGAMREDPDGARRGGYRDLEFGRRGLPLITVQLISGAGKKSRIPSLYPIAEVMTESGSRRTEQRRRC